MGACLYDLMRVDTPQPTQHTTEQPSACASRELESNRAYESPDASRLIRQPTEAPNAPLARRRRPPPKNPSPSRARRLDF